jgi:methionine-rich copper-binding protein CopC
VVTRTARFGAVLAAVPAAVLLAAGPASAHTTLQSAEPAIGSTVASAPTQVVLTFADPVRFPEVVISDAKGKRHQDGKPQAVDNTVTEKVSGTLAGGVYVVGWRVVAPDGHPVSGEYRFIVQGGSGGTAVAPAEKSGFAWWWAALGVLLVGGAGAGIVLLRRTVREEETVP